MSRYKLNVPALALRNPNLSSIQYSMCNQMWHGFELSDSRACNVADWESNAGDRTIARGGRYHEGSTKYYMKTVEGEVESGKHLDKNIRSSA